MRCLDKKGTAGIGCALLLLAFADVDGAVLVSYLNARAAIVYGPAGTGFVVVVALCELKIRRNFVPIRC